MNTSDQNVFTLDTAFKRRWKMRSIKNDIEGCKHADAEYTAALKAEFEVYNNAVVAFEYTTDDMDVVAFANAIEHKGHPQDEFKYIANFLFSRSLADEAYAGVEAPADAPEADKPEDPSPPNAHTHCRCCPSDHRGCLFYTVPSQRHHPAG